ncbi:MAG: cupin domain-containing protein [Candidatus Thermoplasmatota archaeon]|nr:cupin domain-containing protein [Candidatus Thermoplasmatota archaeon]
MKEIFIKKGEAKFIKSVDEKTFKMLVKSSQMQAITAEMEGGAISEFYRHDGEELHIVLKGKIEYQVGENSYEMEEGDVLWHSSNLPHRAKNIGKEKAIYLTVGVPPTFM